MPSVLSPSAIQVRQLRYFAAVVRTGSLRGATTKIGVSQPTLTRQIQQLEEALGVSLLVRNARGIQPTQAGRVLFEDAVELLAQLERALDRARAASGPPSSFQMAGEE